MHTHTEHSRDCQTPIAAQARAIVAAGLDAVCVTDHDTVAGALALREIADGFRVIVGEEITTRDGEILGLFLSEPIPPELSAEETAARVHDQGGIVCVPHPFSRNRPRHLRRDVLDRIWPQVDALEILNARELSAADNRKAQRFAEERRLAGAAGSDAHRSEDVGRAYVEMEDFDSAQDFLESLHRGTVRGRLVERGGGLTDRYAAFRGWLARQGRERRRR